jgi:hypothetical protein
VSIGDPYVFDADLSAAARDEAIERVDDWADLLWKIEAGRALDDLLRIRIEFTTDALWAMLDARGVPRPRESRAMGAVLNRAARAGRIVNTGRQHRTVQSQAHRRPLTIWRVV